MELSGVFHCHAHRPAVNAPTEQASGSLMALSENGCTFCWHIGSVGESDRNHSFSRLLWGQGASENGGEFAVAAGGDTTDGRLSWKPPAHQGWRMAGAPDPGIRRTPVTYGRAPDSGIGELAQRGQCSAVCTWRRRQQCSRYGRCRCYPDDGVSDIWFDCPG